jgi:hypothetical protein
VTSPATNGICARAQRGFSFVLTGSLFYDANDTPHPSKRSGEERMKEYKIYEHHEQAAQHYDQAAKYHREAAKHHKAGNHEKAAHHARIAFGHYLEAAEHQNNAARQHAKEHS